MLDKVTGILHSYIILENWFCLFLSEDKTVILMVCEILEKNCNIIVFGFWFWFLEEGRGAQALQMPSDVGIRLIGSCLHHSLSSSLFSLILDAHRLISLVSSQTIQHSVMSHWWVSDPQFENLSVMAYTDKIRNRIILLCSMSNQLYPGFHKSTAIIHWVAKSSVTQRQRNVWFYMFPFANPGLAVRGKKGIKGLKHDGWIIFKKSGTLYS